MKKIVIGITGSIAAYKTCELISRLKKKNYNIEVIMTKKCSSICNITYLWSTYS